MAEYLSPGVYVEEVLSAVQPIAGVGTSTAGFVGAIADTLTVPKPNPFHNPNQRADAAINVAATVGNLLA